MLRKLFRDDEAFTCNVFADESLQGIFGHFMPLVAYNIFCHVILAVA